MLFLASFHHLIVVVKVILNLILMQVSSPLELLPQGHKEYLRNHLLPNPRTYVNPKGFSFTKKTG